MRTRRTKAEIEGLNEQIVQIVEQDAPLSVRHVFYRMTDPRLGVPVPKDESGYRAVQNRLVHLRRAGVVAYAAIVDTTRRGYFTRTYHGAGDFLERIHSAYRADIWQFVPEYVEVWAESRSIASVIERTCRELAVSLYPSGGFTSESFAYEAATGIQNEIDSSGKTIANVIYIGDYDPAGVLIDPDIEAKLRMHLDDGLDLRMQRIAINEEQIAAYDLPTKPRKLTDKRSLEIPYAVEAEAMPAPELRTLLRESIERYMPRVMLEHVQVAERAEREGIAKLSGIIQSRGLTEVNEILDAQ